MTTRSVHGLDARILRQSKALAHTCRTDVLSARTEVLTLAPFSMDRDT